MRSADNRKLKSFWTMWFLAVVLMVLCSTRSSLGDAIEHSWSRHFGDTSTDGGNSVSATSDGGCLVTGHFLGASDFGGGLLASAGSSDIFVVKLDANGDHVWSRRYGDTIDDIGFGISATSDGGALVTGYFRGTVDFGGGPLGAGEHYDIFVMKLDVSGNHVWSHRFGDSEDDIGYGVSSTPDGGAIVTGYFMGTVDFGGGPLTSTGLQDIFVVKLDANGNHIWSQHFGDVTAVAYGTSVSATAGGESFLTGQFQGTVDFGGGSRSSSSIDLFVLKLDMNGNHVWSRTYGDFGVDHGSGVSTTSDGGVLVTGYFNGTVEFGGEPLVSAGAFDILVVKLDANGNHVWSRQFGDMSGDMGWGVSETSDGGALVTGRFVGTVDFGGGTLTSAGSVDLFVVKLDANGNHVWSRSFGGTGVDNGLAVSATSDMGALLTGTFSGTVDFGGGPPGFTSAGLVDIFVLRLSAAQCLPPPNGIAAWWPLDETVDNHAFELVAFAFGLYMGGATHVPGKVSNGVHLASATQYVHVFDESNLNFGTGSFSIDAWVRLDNSTTSARTIVDKRSGSPPTGYALQVISGHLACEIANDTDGSTTFISSNLAPLTDGVWHFVAMTLDRAGGTNGGRLYVDNDSPESFDPTVRPGSVTNSDPLRIGQANDGSSPSFNGDIDEVELFNVSLSTADVMAIYSAGSRGKCKETVGVPKTALPRPSVTLDLTNNPMRTRKTEIRFTLERENRVSIRVFDLSGRQISAIEPGNLPVGTHRVSWDGTGHDGRPLHSGVYLVTVMLESSGVVGSRTLVVLR